MFFHIEKKIRQSFARVGVIETSHGRIETPTFVAVATKATVKAVTPEQVKSGGVQVVLGNTYHLYLEPGSETVRAAGGIQKFMGWEGPTMTDSGGFQVFSLGSAFGRRVSKVASHHSSVLQNTRMIDDEEETGGGEKGGRFASRLAQIDENGVTFKSFKDGSTHRFTPERSIEIQHDLGADIIFAFDECPSPAAKREYQREAMDRTHRWALRSLVEHLRSGKPTRALFGIVQGGRFEDLRRESAKTIGAMDFDGFGIGGSFEKKDIETAVRWVNEILPEEKPRHLLGIGNPLDILGAVENGVDTFDCVTPTREARTGSLYTRGGRVNITNARFGKDFSPLEEGCDCYTCRNHTRAYLSHLYRAGEMLAATLGTIHNLRFFTRLMADIRAVIFDGDLKQFRDDFLKAYLKSTG